MTEKIPDGIKVYPDRPIPAQRRSTHERLQAEARPHAPGPDEVTTEHVNAWMKEKVERHNRGADALADESLEDAVQRMKDDGFLPADFELRK